MSYDYDFRKLVTGAAPNQYVDEMDAPFIAQQVVQGGHSTGWAQPADPMQHHLVQSIERELSKFNIGLVDPVKGIWAHKPGGSHVFH